MAVQCKTYQTAGENCHGFNSLHWERSVSVVECLTRDQASPAVLLVSLSKTH